MKKSFSILAALTLLSLACQKQTQQEAASDDGGFCKYGFVKSYNDVVQSTRYLKKVTDDPNHTEEDLSDALLILKTDCGDFSEKYGTATCKASTTEGTASNVYANNLIENNCKVAMTHTPGQGKPLPQKPTTGKEDFRYIDIAIKP